MAVEQEWQLLVGGHRPNFSTFLGVTIPTQFLLPSNVKIKPSGFSFHEHILVPMFLQTHLLVVCVLLLGLSQ